MALFASSVELERLRANTRRSKVHRLVHMLDALARDGLIERRHSTVDRRVTINSITDEGRRVVRDIMEITDDLRSELLEGIDSEKLDVAVEVLEDILKRTR